MKTYSEKMELFKRAGLYFVTSSEFSDRPTLEIIEEALSSGVKLFQLREKNISKKELFALGLEARKLASKYNAIFIMNDHLDVALAVKADGVHLGQDDIPLDAARCLPGKDFIIGVSTHNREEIEEAQKLKPSYINIGPVFATQTKQHLQHVGLDDLEELVGYATVPFTFMGGIKEHNVANLKRFNPAAVAMVTEITRAHNIGEKVQKLFGLIGY